MIVSGIRPAQARMPLTIMEKRALRQRLSPAAQSP